MAKANSPSENVRALQRALYVAAKRTGQRKFPALLDRIARLAVAVAEVEGPDAALSLIKGLDLDGYHLYHSVRADLLRRRGRDTEAARAYERALALTGNAREREFLNRRLLEVRREVRH